MKLHLPKMLVAALIAASVSPALGQWAADGKTAGHALYYGANAATDHFDTLTLPNGSNGVSVANPGYVTDNYTNIGLVAGQNGQVISADTVVASQGQNLMIMTNPWGTSNALTANILTLKFVNGENDGSGKLQVDANHTAGVSSVVGTLDKVTNNGTLHLGSADSNIHMAGSIVNNGALELNGTLTYDLSNADAFEKISTSYTQDTPGTNGYAESVTSQCYALKSDNVVSGAVTFAGFDAEGVSQAGWLGNNYVFTMSSAADHVYMANTGTTNNADESDAKRFVVASDATLSITANGTAVIEGSGTVAITKANGLRGLTLDSSWSGWVSLTGTGSNTGFAFNNLGDNIEIGADGYVGWDSDTWSGTNSKNIKFTGTWQNTANVSSGDYTSTFSGTWTGEGKFIADVAAGKRPLTYVLSGNLSGWEGAFESGSGAVTLKLSGNATTMNAAIAKGAGSLAVATEVGVLFNKNITATSLTVGGVKDELKATATLGSLVLNKDLHLLAGAVLTTGGISGNAWLKVAGDSTINLNGSADIDHTRIHNLGAYAATINVGGSEDVGIHSIYQDNSGVAAGTFDVVLNNGAKTTVKDWLTVNSVTITNGEEMEAANHRIGALNVLSGSGTFTSGSAIGSDNHTVNSVSISSGSSLTFGNTAAATITSLTLGTGSTMTVGSAENHGYDLTTTTLTVNGNSTINADLVVSGSGAEITFAKGAVLTMGCDVTISGANVYVTIDGTFDDFMADLRNGNSTLVVIDGLASADEAKALTLSGLYVTDSTGNQFTNNELGLKVVENNYTSNGAYCIVVAPEPATATLSLLALAALASRRKRH